MEAATVVAKLANLPGGQAVIGAVADDTSVWLVGGAVRDLLLERTPSEIDLVVEGPLDDLLGRLGGEAERFERFGTATVLLDGVRIDLASARKETYAQPGALPDVAPASLDEDLRRRDFTINAIAVRICDGEVRADPAALEDLEAQALRVLYQRSFLDDPTRLWRAARYSARLGFSLEPETASLAAAATAGSISGPRLGHELRLALAEPDPTAVFTAVESFNPAALPEGFCASPQGLGDALELLGEDGRGDLLTLAACCKGVELELLTRWLDYLGFTASERDLVAISSRWVTAAPLRNAQTPAQVAAAARGAPIEAVALCGGDNARRWIDELRYVALEISGDELLAAGATPGPAIGAGLQYALELTLDGEIAGAEQQLEAALERAQEGLQ
jgi:tRNA nucleotidyltransferase (CCA-adding enzyme)